MARLFFGWVLMALSIMICAYILPGIIIEDFYAALIAALVLGIINTFIKPIVSILTLPINILSLGLLSFVINALMILLAANLVEGLIIENFLWALVFSVVLSIINGILNAIFNGK